MIITADERTIFLPASALRFKVVGRPPIDFARDRVILLDSDGRGIAECRPLGAVAVPTVQPLEAGKSEPRPQAEPTQVRRRGEPPTTDAGERSPALTEAQVEGLRRMWAENPQGPAEQIARQFAVRFSRHIPADLAVRYRPQGVAR